jgi:hypothetical protein
MTVDKAFALNADAVNMLSSNGNVQGAIDVLREALLVLRQCLVPVVEDVGNVSFHDSLKDTVSGDGQHYTLRSLPTGMCAFSDHQVYNPLYLFNRPILVEECDHTMLTPSDRLLNRISMVVTYNLGLAHHLLGMQNGDNRRKNYSKALRMYHAAYALTMEYPDNRDLLYLAVLNNMGHIYNYSFDSRNIQHCLEGMESILTPYSGNEQNTSDDYTPFFMNVLMFSMQKALAAGAA